MKPSAARDAGGEGSEQEKIAATPASITMRNVSLRSCISWAYDVRDYQISGPQSLSYQKYDILAKSPSAVPLQDLKAMMQTLLADRFKLAVHRESKELPVYTMTIGKKGKLHATVAGQSSVRPVGGAIVFRNYSMPALAERLTERPFSLDRIVLDETRLDGGFDFSVEFADNSTTLKHTLETMADGSQVASMISILEQQLGLTFKTRKAAVESLVVDHAEKVPTQN